MPKVACFEIPGLFCWFWSNDHDPPHFHAKRKGEWEIRVKFLESPEKMVELMWGDTPSSKVVGQIQNAVTLNRQKLLTEWDAKVNQ